MNKKYQKEIFGILEKSILAGYKSGVKSILQVIKKMKYTNVKYDISYTAADEKAIEAFLREAFEVAGVGSFELEEKLKEAGKKYMDGTFKNNDFELEVRRLMLDYGVELGKQPPGAWIRTNIDTAITSATNAARWNRLNEKGISELYPALQYKTQEDTAVRAEHAVLADVVYKKNDPVWNTIYPPNGWNCRCYVKPIGVTEIKDYEVSKSNGKIISEYKAGIDADFQRNCGETDSIWGKWLKQKYRDMTDGDYNEIKNSLKEYDAGRG